MTKGRGKTPGFGGLDKHIKREAHRERGQLASRQRLGALEKHKDYVKRASRRHEKTDRLNKLKRAAAQRNPDEFNIKMLDRVMDTKTGKMKQRKARTRQSERAAEVRENSRSDRYLAHKEQTDASKIKSLLEDVVGLDAPPQNTHTVFVDTPDEVRQFRPTEHFHTTIAQLKKPARRVNLEKAADHLPTAVLQREMEIDAAAMKTVGAASVVEANKEDDDDEPKPFAERLAAARLDAERALRREDRELQRQAALKAREATERRRRQTQLHELQTSLRGRTTKLEAATKRDASRKFKTGAVVRKR